ncbi:MAG TPA: geranylgeranylglycerol-phosphate geranylgeranyltransferase, partial [Candidatus Methanofastidiosa archaeon]|nr:geranylgeranylglycerol-phosphate geranylgeranyltransferase [Candidatus Methanofastidiosa archaeon]
MKRRAMDIKAFIELSRPLNLLLASIAVLLGAFMTKEINYKVAYAVISVALITAGGNAINDYFDFEIDKINKPRRPLPSGRIGLDGAARFSILMFMTGVIVAYLINLPCFIIAILASILLYAYAKDLKNAGFTGNLTIAGLTGMAIIYAGLSVSNAEKIMYVAAFAFLVNLGREIIKDVEDYEGDNSQGARTLPIRYGIKKALYMSLV